MHPPSPPLSSLPPQTSRYLLKAGAALAKGGKAPGGSAAYLASALTSLKERCPVQVGRCVRCPVEDGRSYISWQYRPPVNTKVCAAVAQAWQ